MDWIGNKNSVFKTLGSSHHTNQVRELNDYYATDPVAIDKLLNIVKLPHYIWECACGEGHLSKRLQSFGYDVFSSDLIERGYGLTGINFLEEKSMWMFEKSKPVCILTNPPFKYATEFVLHALEILPPGQPCIMLLKTQALEGINRYQQIYSKGYLEAVYQFSCRLLCAKNGEFNRMRDGGGSAIAYCWAVFRKNAEQPPKIYWI